VLHEAGKWLALVAVLEVAILSAEAVALRVLAGKAAGAVPLRAWVRGAAFANSSSVLLPAGRAAGEAVRATVLAPELGVAQSVGACARLQGCALLANAVASITIGVAAVRPLTSPLALALAGNATVCALLGSAVFYAARSDGLANWLRTRIGFLRRIPPGKVAYGSSPAAVVWCSAGRAIQLAQYGIIVHAVGGVATLRIALAAQGIHIVGSSAGDAIPSQLGATDSAYRIFAQVIGLEPAPALSMALLARVAQLGVGALCVAVAALLRGRPEDGP
jgi:hypothetical protein